MSGISTTLDLKAFQSLLKGLVQIVYYHNPLLSSSNDITREDLVAKVYANSELDVNDKKNEIEIFENILRKAGYENWTAEQLKEFLISNKFSEDHSQVFINYWNRESQKIHQLLLQKVTFNNVMDNIAWRVDIEAMNKSTKDINESGKAYIELQLHQGSNKKEQSVAKFEMERDDITNMVNVFSQIDAAIEALGSNTE